MLNADLFGYKDLSLMTLIIFFIACSLWIAYGIAKTAIPIIIANSVVGVSNLFLIVLKLRYR